MRAVKIIGWVLLGLLVAVVLSLGLGYAVMWLWNWLMPELFRLPRINFWQAVGLLVLSHILFKSHPMGNRPAEKRNKGQWDAFAKRVKTDVEGGSPPTPSSGPNPAGAHEP
jgi:hypothetical protein